MLIISIMVQVDMRFVVRAQRKVKNTKCFYLNIPDCDAKILCGYFLFSYGEVILNHLSRKKRLMDEWGKTKTNFPIKLSYVNNNDVGKKIVLNNSNTLTEIDLAYQNEDCFFEMEKIPNDESGMFSENVCSLGKYGSRTRIRCDLTGGKASEESEEVMHIEITFKEAEHLIEFLIPKESVENTSFGLFLFNHGEAILNEFRKSDPKIPPYTKGSPSFPMKLKFWDPEDDGWEFNYNNKIETVYWDDATFNYLLLENINTGEKINFENNVADPEYSELNCPICLHSLHGPVFAGDIGDGEYNQLMTWLPPLDTEKTTLPNCKHTFHMRCLLKTGMSGGYSCPNCRDYPGHTWWVGFFEKAYIPVKYCQYFYGEKIKEMQKKMDISTEALTDTDKEAKENENKIMYLTNTIESLKKDMEVVNKIKTAALNEFELLKIKTGKIGR